MTLVSRWINRDSETITDKFSTNDLTRTRGCSDVFTTQMMGKGLSFDGGVCGTYYTAANECKFDFEHTNTFSVSFWFNRADTGNQESFVFKSAGTAAANAGWRIFLNAVGRIIFELGNGTDDNQVITATNQDDDKWHHITSTYAGNSDANGMKIYLDGALVSTGSACPITGSILNNCSVTIGAESDGQNSLTGQMACIRVFNTELTAQEVFHLSKIPYYLANNYDDDDLVSFHPLDDDVLDHSVGTNTGTLNGCATLCTAGRVDCSVTLDGLCDFVQLANECNFDFNYACTFSVSLFAKTVSGAAGILVAKKDRQQTNTSGWILFQDAAADLVLKMPNGTCNFSHVTCCFSINDGCWHHVVATYDGCSNESGATIYRDGGCANVGDSVAWSGSILNACNVRIGSGSCAAGSEWNGCLDDVKIYSRELGAQEVKSLARIDEPLSYWRFFGDLTDCGWRNNTATMSAGTATFTGSLFNRGFEFDTSIENRRISVPNECFYDFTRTDKFSIALWLRMDTTHSCGSRGIVVKQSGLSTLAGWSIGMQSGGLGQLMFNIANGTTQVRQFSGSGTRIDDGIWHHTVVTYDGSENRTGMNMYIDGVTIAQASSLAITGDITNAFNVFIGASSNGTNHFPDGIIDSVRIYDRELSALEAQELFNER